MSKWRDRCRERIEELTRDLPDDAFVRVRRNALWGKGWPAHQGTVWGRKMWGEEVRKYLGKHGDPKCVPLAPLFPDHVHFPFRERHDA